ncbi:hypothetical protein D3C71_1545150 [compost metagenome]
MHAHCSWGIHCCDCAGVCGQRLRPSWWFAKSTVHEVGRVGRLRRGRRKYVLVGSVAASMRLTPLRNLPTRPRTRSVCVHHGKQRRKSKATAGRFAHSPRSSFRWIYIHQLTNEKSRADARLHRECFIHAWRGPTVSTRVDTHQQQHRRRSDSSGKLSKAGWVRLRGCPRHGCRGQAPRDGFTASPATGPTPPSHG